MLMGIKLQAHPTENQKLVLSQWMGCARYIWNAKCEEDRYLTAVARKYIPVNTYAPVDQRFAQYKDRDLSPWLYDCPSQILRNSVTNWHRTYVKFMQGGCGKPRKKKKRDAGSVHLTSELFRFEVCDDGVTRLFIGTKTNNIGYLSIKTHRKFKEPKSIYIKKKNGRYTVSLAFDDGVDEKGLTDQAAYLKKLSKLPENKLDEITIGIDRGVTRPEPAGEEVFDFSTGQKKNKTGKEKYLKRLQRRLARQKKGSNRRFGTKRKICAAHTKIANIRRDFCHKTSRAKGQSAAAKADYILRDGKYRAQANEILHAETGNMPGWAHENPRGFWKATDAHSRKNGRLFSEIEFALPHEMTRAQQVDLARAFARKVTDRPCGEDVTLPYTLAIHRGDLKKKNVHCHLVFSDRGNDGIDRDPEQWFKRANKKEPEKGGAAKVRGLVAKQWLTDTMADWASVANKHLEKGGYEDRIDHRSLKDQGINRIPQIHVGPAAFRMAKKDLEPERLARYHQIRRANQVDKKEEAVLVTTLKSHEDAVAARLDEMYGKGWQERLREGAERNRIEMEKYTLKIKADLKQQRLERDRQWERDAARKKDEAKRVAEAEAAKAEKAAEAKKIAEAAAAKRAAEAKKVEAEKGLELTSTAAKPKKAPEDEKAVDPKENEDLRKENAVLKQVLLEYKKLEWERAGSKGPQPERLGAAPKDVVAIKKENELLKKALDNYKRHDDQRAYGKGHEKG